MVTSSRIEIWIRQKGDFKYTTEFIGTGGKILLRTGSNPARYALSDSTNYVRVRVTDSAGLVAWIQPVFVVQ